LPNTAATNRVLSGMRPTGRLHIGHYFGALQNWVKLQSDPAYECFYFVADWHALTSDYADTSAIAENTLQITIDYLAAGLDPAKSVIFQQSLVPEHAELHLLLSMITPLGWLERIPTYKEALDNIQNRDLHTYGFLGYPTLQTSDIVIYSDPGKGLVVPVGEDQVSHVEFSRELVRRFNAFYGFKLREEFFQLEDEKALGKVRWALDLLDLHDHVQIVSTRKGALSAEERTALVSAVRRRVTEIGLRNLAEEGREHDSLIVLLDILTEPSAFLTPTPRVPGLDGRKMSKSYGNAISLSESDADIRSKAKVMITDPKRKRRTDPGEPNDCPVYDWHKLFSTPERDPGRLKWVQIGCRSAGIGCVECKCAMADNLIKWIEPIRARRVEYEQHPKRVLEILDHGSAAAQKVARETMSRVREAIFGWQRKRQETSG
jgi:tryptophanyl-tRNA synthetase